VSRSHRIAGVPSEPPMRFLACCFAFVFAPVFAHADDWQSLFNGKDTAGWKAVNDPESFKVVDGVLRIQSTGKAAHLFYVGDLKEGVVKFKDFELEATVKSEPNANGGIFIHTDMKARLMDQILLNGYEVQLNSSPREKIKTGSLYAVVDLDKSPVDETKWFTIRIVVKGKRIMVAIDGKEVVDYTEPKDAKRPPDRAGRLLAAEGGGIALQAHDPKSVWYFKEIRIKRFP
jgi:hypothetical protein